jgi:predicted outer membrane repeat protein
LLGTTLSGNRAGSVGGGLIANGPATLTSCTIVSNSAVAEGGGIHAGTATLARCTVAGNSADFGGGIWAVQTTLTNCTVNDNAAGGSGGGIFAFDTATLTNSTVSGNSADFGGGIRAMTAATLTNSTVSDNRASGSGGGINAATATLTTCTVSDNSAGSFGGGIAAVTATLTNATISGNRAVTEGGGLWASEATLSSCTIAENMAQNGGGLFHNAGGMFTIRNTIVALNLVDFTGSGPDINGVFVSLGHNLIGIRTESSNGFTNGVNNDQVGTAVNPIDPRIGVLQNNGGRTKTHALLAGSPAIDRGDSSLLPPTDQRGFARLRDSNGDGIRVVDIGAFER